MPAVEANGVTLDYEALGDASRPAIVLVMGLGANMLLWPDELCTMLAGAGFRVIRFDNRDCGRSTILERLGTPNIPLAAMKHFLHLPLHAPYLIDDMARDTEALLDALGIASAHLVGASMGGMIAQNLAARSPARVSSLTSIMSTTGNRKLPGPSARARRALLQPPAAPGDFEGAVRRMGSVLTEIGSRTHPPEPAWLRALCERHVRRGNHPSGAARQLMAIVASGDRTPIVGRIRVPALVLHGDEDPLLKPACGEATAQAIRAGGGDVALEIVHGMGHDLPLPLLPRIAERIAGHCSLCPGKGSG
ncbi:MAG TPA: alpha/beta hydrolase [Usitatibacter sp.]|jgi:proline iminopeptidase|nr:alpha/beta hydrolase [Usitatibacter sp.]